MRSILVSIWVLLLGVDHLPAEIRTEQDEKAGALADRKAYEDAVQNNCGPYQVTMQDTTLSVFARAEASREYRRCVERKSASYVASTADTRSFAANQMTQVDVAQAKELERDAAAPANFMNLSWGLGFGYSFGFDEAIEEAEVVDGIVRVTKDKTDQPRAALEFHRYFWCNKGATLEDRGCGPFLAVAATPDEVLSGVGVGFMYGRRPKQSHSEDGFSIGIGAILDADVRTLADGFAENQPLPVGETSVRYEEKARWSALLLITRTF